MKIVIVGGGNAGCLTALYFGFHGKIYSALEIELIYDPDTPPEVVGQATLLSPPNLLWRACGVDWLHNTIKATPKLGILYKGWGKNNRDSTSPFPLHAVGLHYSPHEMREVVLSSGLFKVTEAKVEDIETIDADYIFDCRGRPKDLSNYDELINK